MIATVALLLALRGESTREATSTRQTVQTTHVDSAHAPNPLRRRLVGPAKAIDDAAYAKAEQERAESERRAENDRETLWLAIGMFLLTGIVAYFAYKLVADGQSISQRQQRAYLGFSYRWIHGKRKEDGRLETEELEITSGAYKTHYKTGVYVSNFGQTPATVLFKGMCGEFETSATGEELLEKLSSARETGYEGVSKPCNPGTELPLYFELRGSKDGIMPLNNWASLRPYAVGIVLYRDIFDRWHFTKLCTYYNESSTTGSTWVTESVFNDTGDLTAAEFEALKLRLWPPN